MTVEEAIKSINRAIGVGQRKVSSEVITKKLVYPHKVQQECCGNPFKCMGNCVDKEQTK